MENGGYTFRSIEEIPLHYRKIFEQYPCFNSVQSKVFDDAFNTDASLIVSAPTGSGKTAIFELALVRLLTLHHPTSIKAVYVSPIKALCKERFMDWQQKFSNFSIQCISVTGDSNDIDLRNLLNYNLIITTPEKWDVVTRRWRNNHALVANINLFMIDEIHLLNTESRGSTLEVIVTRMKTIDSLTINHDKAKIRFLALSATIPNIEDIAEWIGPKGTAKYHKFSEDVRPVKLNKIVLGFPFHSNDKSIFKFDLSLNYKLQNLIASYSNGQPTLIFCNTRKSVEMTAKHLVSNLQIHLRAEQKKLLYEICDQFGDHKLKQHMIHGIAYHHAGLDLDNRHTVEEAFRGGHIPILVTTSTLAMGVNLPAHLVIIKSTKCYDSNGGYKDYDDVSIFQMIGRAGRCQFDTTATAIIMTSVQDQQKYEKMVSCTQQIESNLHKHLPEHLNAEIVLKTIIDLDVAMRWLSSTFLYVRASKCPEKYKLPVGVSKDKLDKKLLEMCQIQLNKLVKADMVRINETIDLSSTVLGEIMAKYYVALDTMALFTQVSGNEILMQLTAVFSKCREFSDIFLRTTDKKCLNFLNKNKTKESIRFPLAGRIKTVDMKVNCIIQAVFGNLEISNQSLINDSVRILRHCERLSKCLIEYLETKSTNYYTALKNATILAKCFRAKLWENSQFVSKQLTGVGQVLSTLLAKAEKTSFKNIAEANPRMIEMFIGRKPPFGNIIIEEAKHIPRYEMTMEKMTNKICLKILLLNVNIIKDKITVDSESTMTLLVGDSNNNLLLYEKYSHSYMIENPEVEQCIRLQNDTVTYVTADFISDDWVGFDCHFQLKIRETVSAKLNENNSGKQTFMEMYMPLVKGKKVIKSKDQNKTKKEIQESNAIVSPIDTIKSANTWCNNGKMFENMDINSKEFTKDSADSIKSNTFTTEINTAFKDIDTTFKFNNSISLKENVHNSKDTANELNTKKIFRFKHLPENDEEQLPNKNNNNYVIKEIIIPNIDTNVINIQQHLAIIPETINEPKIINDQENTNEKEAINNSSNAIDDNFLSWIGNENDDNLTEYNAKFKNMRKKYENILQNKEIKKKDNMVEGNVEFNEENGKATMIKPIDNRNKIKSPFILSQRNQPSHEEPQQKSITWRSPLIHSPLEKYSRYRKSLNDINGNTSKEDSIESYDLHVNETSSSNISTTSLNSTFGQHKKLSSSDRKNFKFALCDQDYNMVSLNRKQRKIDDIIEMEYFGLSTNNPVNNSSQKYTPLRPNSGAIDYYKSLIRPKNTLNPSTHSTSNERLNSSINYRSSQLSSSSIANSQLIRNTEQVATATPSQSSKLEKSYPNSQRNSEYVLEESPEMINFPLPSYKDNPIHNGFINLNQSYTAENMVNLPMKKKVECDQNVSQARNHYGHMLPYRSLHGFSEHPYANLHRPFINASCPCCVTPHLPPPREPVEHMQPQYSQIPQRYFNSTMCADPYCIPSNMSQHPIYFNRGHYENIPHSHHNYQADLPTRMRIETTIHSPTEKLTPVQPMKNEERCLSQTFYKNHLAGNQDHHLLRYANNNDLVSPASFTNTDNDAHYLQSHHLREVSRQNDEISASQKKKLLSSFGHIPKKSFNHNGNMEVSSNNRQMNADDSTRQSMSTIIRKSQVFQKENDNDYEVECLSQIRQPKIQEYNNNSYSVPSQNQNFDHRLYGFYPPNGDRYFY